MLYNKYAGHDNNRDFYMAALAETQNMNRSMYREWFPQIVYNHHQTGPQGTVMFAPPFRDPPNHYLDPLIITSLDRVGSAMHQRFVLEGKGGTTMRSGRLVLDVVERRPADHAVLQEHDRAAHGDNRASHAHRDTVHSGAPDAEGGHPASRRAWTVALPSVGRILADGELGGPRLCLAQRGPPAVQYLADGSELDRARRHRLVDDPARSRSMPRPRRWIVEIASDWERILRAPADRDPRGFIIPRNQRDFPTATKFVNTLLYNGVDVHRATRDFIVAGTSYPAGSYVVKGDQAFRPHVLDMFEKQQHPNDFAFPGCARRPRRTTTRDGRWRGRWESSLTV